MSNESSTPVHRTSEARTLHTWVSIVGFLITLGIAIGGFTAQSKQMADNQMATSAELKNISKEMLAFRDAQQEQKFLLANLTAETGRLTGAMDANQKDDLRQWETIRRVEARAEGAVQKTDFLEWRIQLERKNPTIVSPPLEVSKSQ